MSAEPPTPPRLPKRPPPEVVESPRIARLRGELEGGDHTALERFWSEVGRRTTPLVEESTSAPGRCTATFVWRDRHGTAHGTQQVVLMANKLTDPSVWEQSQLRRVPGTDVWQLAVRLATDWRGSYRLAPDDGTSSPTPSVVIGPARRWRSLMGQATADPLNPTQLPGPSPSDPPLSIAEMPDAPAQPWLRPREVGARGTVTAHRVASRVLGNERTVHMYSPPGDPGGPLPVLVVLDGDDWLRRLGIASTLDNLIAEQRIPPSVALLVSTIDVRTRWEELGAHRPFLQFLTDELLPWVAVRAPVTSRADASVLVGRSLGALSCLYAGAHVPDRFGALLCQSASLWHPVDGDRRIHDLYAHSHPPVKVYLEVGRDEWVLLDDHRRLRHVLARGGHDVTYREYSGGHDIVCWRGSLADGLMSLLGPEAAPSSPAPGRAVSARQGAGR